MTGTTERGGEGGGGWAGRAVALPIFSSSDFFRLQMSWTINIFPQNIEIKAECTKTHPQSLDVTH